MNCKKCHNVIPDGSIYCNWCGEKQIKSTTGRKEIKVPDPVQLPSGTWFVRLMVNGERASFCAETEALCRAQAVAFKAGLLEKKALKRDAKTVGAVIDEYIDRMTPLLSPSTIDGYKRKRKNNLQGLMLMPPHALTTDNVNKAIAQECKKYSGKTVVAAWSLIQTATGISLDGIKTPSAAPKKKPPVYTSEQIRALLIAVQGTGEVECAVLLALWLSLRRSEILALRRSDLHSGYISVMSAIVFDDNGRPVEKPTKTVKSARNIPCPAYVMERLEALPGSEDGYLFTRSKHYLSLRLTDICAKHDLPHMYLHGLRHLNASVMAMLGVDTKYAQERGGWSTEYTMRNVYQDVMTEGKLAVAKQIDDYFLGLLDQPST